MVRGGAGGNLLAPSGGLLGLPEGQMQLQQLARHAVAPRARLGQLLQQLGRPPPLTQPRRCPRHKQPQLGAAPPLLLAQRQRRHCLHAAPHTRRRQPLQLLKHLLHQARFSKIGK